MKGLFHGVCTALVTPFKNGKVDYFALKNLIDYQKDNGVSAICVLGTTGEPCTMSQREKKEIIKFCAANKGDLTLIVGSGSNDTKKAIKQSEMALENGADGLLVVTPYYNRCTQKGLCEYYASIFKATKAKIIAYNVPSRTGVNILPETLKSMAEDGSICGFKQANPSIAETMEIFSKLRGKIDIFSGEDAQNYLFYALGGSGAISVTANAFPKIVVEVYDFFMAGKREESLKMQEKLAKINQLLFAEVNPIPIKYCLNFLGLCKNELRPPLTKMDSFAQLDKEIELLIK